MRRLMWSAFVVALLVGLSPYGLGGVEPSQTTRDVKSMTVAELEKAGDTSRAQKDYAQAIEYFREAVRKDKKNAGLYNKLGLAELKNGDYPGARVDFEKASKLNKKYADALNNLGAVYFVQNNYGQAARYFKKAVALDETRPVFHINQPGTAKRRWSGRSMSTPERWNWIRWRWNRTPGSASPPKFRALKSARSSTT
jgi:tetratricopeptide (TPR) repeat protein